MAASDLDWSEIDPSILGTLFERGLDPGKRAQLGAHYTDRDKIMLLVEPVVIRPLLVEWEAEKTAIAAELERAEAAKSSAARTKRRNEAERRLRCCRARSSEGNRTPVDRKMSWSPAASSSQQRARVLTGVKARRFAPPPLRGADGPDAGSAHARPDWLLLTMPTHTPPTCCGRRPVHVVGGSGRANQSLSSSARRRSSTASTTAST